MRIGIGARCGGFTYIGLIVLLAILGLVGAAGMKTGSLMQRAAAEEELLEIGAAFSDALRSYAAATPKGQPVQPPNLQALLRDPRFPEVRRHLRKIFVDPVTGKAEWGVMTMGDNGGVTGVYSLSAARPLKVANFDVRFVNFERKEHLSDWKFTAAGQGAVVLRAVADAPPGAPPAPGTPAAPPVPGAPGAVPPAADGQPPEPEPPEPPEVPEPAAPATDEPPPADKPAEAGQEEESPEPPAQEDDSEDGDGDDKAGTPPKPKPVAN
ncbi:MAG: type II secretion system protein [Telluria sp.]